MTNSTQKTGHIYKLTAKLVIVSLVMFSFGFWIMPPLYYKFCEVVGIGTTDFEGRQVAEGEWEVDESRTVKVHFDASVNSQLPWQVQPQERFMEVVPGRLYETTYLAFNQSPSTVVGQAVPSVAPGNASLYFSKVECFCFEQQPLAGNETKEMPVRFMVDPRLPENVDLITLSYILYKNDEATAAIVAVVDQP